MRSTVWSYDPTHSLLEADVPLQIIMNFMMQLVNSLVAEEAIQNEEDYSNYQDTVVRRKLHSYGRAVKLGGLILTPFPATYKLGFTMYWNCITLCGQIKGKSKYTTETYPGNVEHIFGA